MKEISQMSLPELRALAVETDDVSVLWEIMQNCKEDAHTIQKIIENPCARFDHKLVRIAYDKGDARVKMTIARHTAEESIIDNAASSDNRSIRCNAALNPNISVETLRRLSRDSWWGVRASVLSNEKVTGTIIQQIASYDTNYHVRGLARDLLEKTSNF